MNKAGLFRLALLTVFHYSHNNFNLASVTQPILFLSVRLELTRNERAIVLTLLTLFTLQTHKHVHKRYLYVREYAKTNLIKKVTNNYMHLDREQGQCRSGYINDGVLPLDCLVTGTTLRHGFEPMTSRVGIQFSASTAFHQNST